MKKSVFRFILLFILLTTYTPRLNFNFNSNLKIQKIIIKNNQIVDADKVKQNLSYLYNKNLFFLKTQDIEKILKKESFIESFSLKKIYPNKLRLKIVEKKPIAILHIKKKKFYISDKGDLIDFKNIDMYDNLPRVFGSSETFFSLYQTLENIQFPFKTIKSFYFFESSRWDLVMQDDQVIKLPNHDYLLSLKNFMNLKKNSDFNNYKIFDYRIKNQLILN